MSNNYSKLPSFIAKENGLMDLHDKLLCTSKKAIRRPTSTTKKLYKEYVMLEISILRTPDGQLGMSVIFDDEKSCNASF